MGDPRASLRAQETRLYLLVGVFFAGATSLALEMVASRLYAPYFGASIYVWGVLISVVMVAMSTGYALGGYWSERQGGASTLCMIWIVNSLYQLAMMFVAVPLLEFVARYPEKYGTLLASVFIYFCASRSLFGCNWTPDRWGADA